MIGELMKIFMYQLQKFLNIEIINLFKKSSVIKFDNDFEAFTEDRKWQINSWKENQKYFLNFLNKNNLNRLYAYGSYYYLLMKIFRFKDLSFKLLLSYLIFYPYNILKNIKNLKQMKKKILVLGSEGQIGSHLIEYIEKKTNYKAIRFDILLRKNNDLRIYNNKNLETKIKSCDFVFFLAFDVGGSKYLKKYQNSFNFLNNNILIMSNTFNLLKKYNKKFIFASSQMSNMDFSSYGVLKKIGEDITKSLNCLYVKFWNVYGVEKDKEKAHVITDFVLMALKDKKIKMLTSGRESREFLYADDCSDALLHNEKILNIISRKKKRFI